MNFTIEIVSDFEPIKQDWWQLMPSAATNQVFLTPTFQQTWWESMGQGQLLLITFRRPTDNQLVGLASLYIFANELQFVGCKAVSDYLDFVINKEMADQIYPVLAETIIKIIKNNKIQEVEFCSLPETSLTLKILPGLINQLLPGKEVKIAQQDVCPQIKLPATFDSYLGNLDRKQRHEILRKIRKIERETEFQFRQVTDSKEVTSSVSTFIKLHQLSSPQKYDFWNDQHRAFFDQLLPALAQQNITKLFFVEIEKLPVAAMLVFDYNNQYLLYNSGYDPAYKTLSVGQVLTVYTIKDAIKQQKGVYDFLRGDEEYKFRLGGQAQPIMDISIKI